MKKVYEKYKQKLRDTFLAMYPDIDETLEIRMYHHLEKAIKETEQEKDKEAIIWSNVQRDRAVKGVEEQTAKELIDIIRKRIKVIEKEKQVPVEVYAQIQILRQLEQELKKKYLGKKVKK